MKQKSIWLIKLFGLTLAIYWFMTKGFTSTVGKEAGITEINSSGGWQAMFSGTNGMITISVLIFFIMILIHDVRERKSKKPKSNR